MSLMGKIFTVKYAMIVSLMMITNLLVEAQEKQPVDLVDPMIGSGGHGHVFVGANVPFGAVQVGPNNIYKGWDWCSGYHYSDSLIIGFSHLHLSGTGIGDLGDVLIMPFTGDIRVDKGRQQYPHGGYLSTFKHENEKVIPGYYAVRMDNGVGVELTATERVGYHRYVFPKNEIARIIIDLKEGVGDKSTETMIKLVDEHTLLGSRSSSGWAKKQQVFFAIRFATPVKDLLLYDDTVVTQNIQGKALKALITMNNAPALVELKVGLSPVSPENALQNIDKEIPAWDFDRVVKEARQKWNHELSKISIETTDLRQKKIFYTSLYHAFMHPSLFNDHEKSYRGTDNKVYGNASFNNYSIFSTWDTYRAAHSLFTLVQGERVDDFVNSMLAIYDQQGYLPIWHLNGYETGTMVGISSQQVIAEAFIKGYKGFDKERAFQAIRTTAMSDLRGMSYVQKFQAIPTDAEKLSRVVGHGLELAISDGSTALMAQSLKKKEDYEYFKKRADNYKLYYDPKVGFFRGRKSDGTWPEKFDPVKSTKAWARDYAEGNAWQYLWLVPHDPQGLMELLGGRDIFVKRLDEFFALPSDKEEALVDLSGLIGQYAHGNEPSHHIAYLYNFAGQPWKTAEKVRYIMKEFYHDAPDGLIGNEDCGQMSSWYAFSSLGFYPVFPASGKYVFGSPLFDKATIKLPGGKTFTVIAENGGPENIYIQDIKLNGRRYTRSYIDHMDIVKGGTLVFMMGKSPK